MLSKVTLLISFRFLIVLAHWDGAYFRNADDGFQVYNNWMERIRDDALLTELALPGTHDSGTFTSSIPIVNAFVKTQVLTFSEQLEYGIRFFDIRMRHTENQFELYHGSWSLGIMFSDFLDAVTKFLREHPSEVVLFRLKEDHSPGNNTRSMHETLEEYLNTYKSAHLQQTYTRIRLGEARGKFLIISDNYEFHDYGIAYNHFRKQDMYTVMTNWDLYKKWEAIRAHLDTARNGDKSTFYINYLSASGGVLPYFVASGHITSGTSAPRLATGLATPFFKSYYPDFPRLHCVKGVCIIAFEGTNTLTRDYLKNNPQRRRSAGVIVADFPGTDLILTIINENF